MNSNWIYNLKWNRSLQVALILTLVIPGLLIGGVFLTSQRIAAIAMEQLLEELSTKTGFALTCVGKEVGFGDVQLREITVAGFQELKIAAVTSEYSLNPFSASFLKIKALEIKGLNLVATDQDSGMTALIGLLEKTLKPSESAENKNNSKLGSLRKLFTEHARIVLTDANVSATAASENQSLNATGLYGILDPQLLKFSFFAASLAHSSGNSLTQIKGYIEFRQPKSVRIQIAGPSTDAPLGWSTTLDITGNENALSAVFDTTGLPDLLSNHLQSIISMPGALSVQGSVTVEKMDSTKYRFSGTSQFSPLSVQHRLISQESIGPFVPGIRYSGSIDTKLRRAVVKKMILTLFSPSVATKAAFPGIQLGLSITGDFSNKNSPFGAWSGFLKVPQTSCQTALEVAPTGLTPGIKDFLLSGDFNLDADLRFDSQFPDRYFFQPTKSGFNCQVSIAPMEYSADRLRNSFRFSRTLPDGSEREFVLDPGSSQFTPINRISRHMITAVVSSEDAGFWSNDGVDFNAIDVALRNNLKNNKVMSGGSTITMQTVKNLFLSQNRTLSRKAQELFLSWHLHNTIKKDRLMEIYLNIIEFGPGIYGITQAAEHFFRKTPFDLNLKEAVFLASVLPSPIRRYRQFCHGKLSPGYEDLLTEKLNQMYGQGRIPMETVVETRAITLNFNSLPISSQYTCMNLENSQKPKKV